MKVILNTLTFTSMYSCSIAVCTSIGKNKIFMKNRIEVLARASGPTTFYILRKRFGFRHGTNQIQTSKDKWDRISVSVVVWNNLLNFGAKAHVLDDGSRF